MIGIGRYGEILKRLFNVDAGDPSAVFGDLSPEFSPVFVLESERPEWEFLSNQRHIFVAMLIAASPGNRSLLRIRNPSASSTLAVVERATCVVIAAAFQPAVWAGVATTDRATVAGALVVEDSRYSQIGISQGACVVSADNAAAAGTNFEVNGQPANTPYDYRSLPYVLGPGSHLDIGPSDLNVAAIVNVRWRERELTKYEKR